MIASKNDLNSYVAGTEYNYSHAVQFPRNCAVIERTADDVNVGPCTHFLENGTTCPRHGKVKREEGERVL